MTREFLEIYKRVLAGETVKYTGKHFRIEEGRPFFPPAQAPIPSALLRRIVPRRRTQWRLSRSTSI